MSIDEPRQRFGADDEPRLRFVADLTQVCDRLRSMSLSRLEAPVPPHTSRVAAAHSAASTLSLLAQGVEDRGREHPSYREFPDGDALTVADQLAVCGTDLALAAEGLSDDTEVWSGMTRTTVAAVLTEADEVLRRLRTAL